MKFDACAGPEPYDHAHRIWLAAWMLSASAAIHFVVNDVRAQSRPASPIEAAGYAAPRDQPMLVWLDDRRLLFTGWPVSPEAKARYPYTGEAAKWSGTWTFVWDTRNGVVERMSDWDTVCYSPTFVHQVKRLRGSNQVERHRLGPRGDEREYDVASLFKLQVDESAADRIYSNSFTCRRYAGSKFIPPIPDNRRIGLLRDGDGFFDSGARDEMQLIAEHKSGKKIRWYHPSKPEGVDIAARVGEAGFISAYSSYAKKYVMPRSNRLETLTPKDRWMQKLPHRFFLFDPLNGRLDQMEFPIRKLDERLEHLNPLRGGWLLVNFTSLSDAALLHFDGHTLARLEAGSVAEVAVSANGCRAAYVINTASRQMESQFRVKMVEFCR